MQGIVQSVNVTRAGGFPIAPASAGSTTIPFADAADFDETGGTVSIGEVLLDYVSADLELDTITLAAPLGWDVTEDDFVAVHPHTEETYAIIVFDGRVEEAEVPHSLKALLPEGIREIGQGEAVILRDTHLGVEIVDIVGRAPSVDASFIENAEELLLADQETLGAKLAAARADIEAARGRLDEAESRLDDAFSEIEIKPDQAYVDAAKQQAIDAAAAASQADAQQALDDARAYADSVAAGLENRVVNPGFESGLEGWSEASGRFADETVAFEGGTSMRLEVGSAAIEANRIEVTEGQTLRWKAWFKTTPDYAGNAGMRPIRVDGGSASNVPGYPNFYATEEWQLLTLDWTIPASTERVTTMRFAGSINTGTVWVDSVSLTDVTELVGLEARVKAYTDAAKQDAIDTASATSLAQANLMYAQAQNDLAAARGDLEDAIATGDADAIADAEAAVAAAKTELEAFAIARANQAEANAIEAAELDATAKAGEAMTKATEALSKAQAAQATADGAIRTFYETEPPWPNGSAQPDEHLGDMWFDVDTGQAYRWNGTTWTVIVDQTIGQALAAAQDAQSTADGKITAFYQDAEPLAGEEGDLWFDTNDNNKPHYRSAGGTWVSLEDARIAQQANLISGLQTDLTGLEGAVDGKSNVYVQAAAPTGLDADDKGDIWINDGATPRTTQVWTGTAWIDADSRITKAVADITTKITTYYTASTSAPGAPSGGFTAGDLWVDSNGKLERWSGSAWEIMVDPKALADGVELRAASRGTDLVTNGTAYLRNNYNFSSLTYDGTDAPVGSSGSYRGAAQQSQVRIDEWMPVNPSKVYQISCSAKQRAAPGDGSGRLYMFYEAADSVGEAIQSSHFKFVAGTTTTLAAPLNPGDTTVQLANATGWHNGSSQHFRRFIFWDYVDANGKLWEPETYSRNTTSHNTWPEGGISGNTITLNSPYSGPARPAGTSVSCNNGSSSYLYIAWNNVTVSRTWERRSDFITGTADPATGNNIPYAGKYAFPPGTASIRIGWLMNYNSTGVSDIAIAGVSLSDASAAQAAADAAMAAVVGVQGDLTGLQGQVDGKATIYVQTNAPSGLDADDQGDIWIDTSSGRVTKVWTGSAWQEADTRTAQALAEVSTKITTYYGAEPGGSAFTTGDLWVDADGKIARWSGAAWTTVSDPKALADQAEANAKAFATTRTDGLAKTLWSTALPGTTTAPQNSVWYRHDAGGKIIAVFTQTAAGSAGSTWVARPITSEAIDNLDVGKLTAASGVVNDLVANAFAAKLANIIEANIGNLTVTGDTHLSSLVAEQIAGDTASFIQLTVDQVLAGNIQAVWNIVAGGKIIAGDPGGARVEITSDGIRLFALGYNGVPYEAISMVNGEISFAVVDQTRGMLGGISKEGDVTGQRGIFAKSLAVRGTDLVGQLGDVVNPPAAGTPPAAPGWLDMLPRGILPGARRVSTLVTTAKAANSENPYLRVRATLLPKRLYRVVSRMDIRQGTTTGATRARLRYATGGASATLSSPIIDIWTNGPNYNAGVETSCYLEDTLTVDVETDVEVLTTYAGLNGGTPAATGGFVYIEDVGPRGIDLGGEEDETPKTLYTTTWKATASRGYAADGSQIPAKEDAIDLWYLGAVAESAAVLFGGTAETFDDISESGRTMSQALTGATIHSVKLTVTNAMWWNDAITDMGFGSLGASTLPTSKVVEGEVIVFDIAEGTTTNVDLPPSWFTNGGNRGVTMGDKDGMMSANGSTHQMGAGKFQGPGDPGAPLLTVTYSR